MKMLAGKYVLELSEDTINLLEEAGMGPGDIEADVEAHKGGRAPINLLIECLVGYDEERDPGLWREYVNAVESHTEADE